MSKSYECAVHELWGDLVWLLLHVVLLLLLCFSATHSGFRISTLNLVLLLLQAICVYFDIGFEEWTPCNSVKCQMMSIRYQMM